MLNSLPRTLKIRALQLHLEPLPLKTPETRLSAAYSGTRARRNPGLLPEEQGLNPTRGTPAFKISSRVQPQNPWL